jgi:localization factor PodJL
MPRLAARLEQGVADLTRRVDALAGTTVDRKEIAALTGVISDIRAKLSQPASGPDSTNVERRIEALSAKIDDVMREPLGLVGQHLADLTARLGKAREGISPEAFSDMRAKLDRIAEQADRPALGHPAGNGERALSAIRDKLDHLAERLDRTPPGLDGSALNELRDRIDRLSHSIADLARQAPDNGNAMLAEVRDRLDQLAERLDRGLAGIDGHALADLRGRLDTLSRSIEHFAERAPENSIALFEVRDRLDHLAHRLHDMPAGVDDRVIGELHDRMDRLSRSIEGLTAPGSSSGDATLAELRDRLDRLAQRLDTTATASDAGAIAELRDRLDRLAQSVEQSALESPDRIDRLLRQIAASIDVARSPDGNSGSLKALERQVAALGERLDGAKDSRGAMGELERSVARLFGEVAETKAAAIKAAQTAASGGVYQAKDASTMPDERAGDRDMLATLDQMNTTLERLMDRLSSLETRAWAPDDTSSSYLPSGVGRAHSEPARAAEQPSGEPVTEEDDMLRPGVGSTPADKSRRAAAEKRPIPYPRGGAASGNEPLEPGSGRPISKPASDAPLRATKDKVAPASAAASIAADPGAGNGISSTMSAQALIAAARRAAADTAARQQTAAASASSSPINAAKEALSTLRASAGAHKKPILLALIGLMVVFSAVGAGRLFLSGDNAGVDQSIPATAVAPTRAAPGEAAPAKPATPPPSDAATPAKQGSAQAPATNAAAEPPAPTFARIGQATVAPPSPGEASLPASGAVASLAPSASISSAAPPPKQGAGNPAPMATLTTAPDPSAPDFVSKLRLAANADDPIAEYELAARMYDGRGAPRDTQGAARLFERAANQGLAPAQYRIANIYETGVGATKDLVLAKAWFEKAAARGNAKAMHNVGVYLAQGIQGKPDYTAAISWFRKAAERNVRDSQYNLAILLARGLGTARDFKASYVWFALAAREGDADSAKKRDEVAAHLTSAELDDAKAAIAQWKPIEVDRSANEINVGDIKWDRFGPAAIQVEQPGSSKL